MIITIREQLKNANIRFNIVFRRFGTIIYFSLSTILLLLIWFLAFELSKHIASGLVILRYNVDFGINLIGEPKDILRVPYSYAGVYVVNLVLLFVFAKNRDFHFIRHLLFSATLIVGLFFLMAIASVYLKNFL